MIIVVSHEEDVHAERVLQHLRRDGHACLLLNLTQLPNRATLTFDYARAGVPAIRLLQSAGTEYELDQARSVWWRRPQMPDPSSVTDAHLRLFTANEWNEAIGGLWQLMRVPWMNDPVRDEVASRKALQLHLARDVGLRIPRTLITSDPDRARRFIEAEGIGRTVYKTFSCTHAVWRETRLVRGEDLDQLEAVRIAPVIFQEYVPAGCDLRITVVGTEMFAAAIRPERGDNRVDFRMRVGHSTMEPFDLPGAASARLRTLMGRLGLVYGAIDMRVTPDGEYFFLEVNTAGEFLFIEERTGLPIARALATWLANPTPA